MPFNGSGTASPPNPPTFPAVSGQTIEAAKFNAIINDLYACLTQVIAKDGQTVITGILQWADKASNLDALGAVSLTATQVVDGVKTFSSAPVSSAAAVAADELMRKGEVDSAVAAAVPSGAVMPFARNTAPSGWLKCDGSLVSRTTYAALFTAIGTTFGAGDGSTTFALPDLRGEFVRGWDDGRGVDSGRSHGSPQLDAFQGHWHQSRYTSNITAGPGEDALEDGSVVRLSNSAVVWPVSDGVNGEPRTASETRPRNVALLYCIKT